MLAMPGATTSRVVLASSHDECTMTSRPRLSGIHKALYPHASTRLAKAAPSAALIGSIAFQTPSLPSCMRKSSARRIRRRRHVREAGAGCEAPAGPPPAGASGLQVAGDRVERAAEVGADGAHHDNRGDRDQRGDQPVFDGGHAALVPQQGGDWMTGRDKMLLYPLQGTHRFLPEVQLTKNGEAASGERKMRPHHLTGD